MTTKAACLNKYPHCSCGVGVGLQAQQNLYSFASEDRDMLHRLIQKTKWDDIPMISHADELKMRNLSPVSKAPTKVEKEKALINHTVAKPTGVYGTEQSNRRATAPSPSSSRSSHSDAPPSREEIPPSPTAVSAGQVLSHAAKKKAKAARKEEKEAEALKVALASAAASAPEVQKEEQLPPKEQCRLCDDEIQPKKDEYCEYSCGSEIGKEVCHFYTHKKCLNSWYDKNRGASRKGEWKNTRCITGDCEENMLCVNIIHVNLEKTLHIKSNPVVPSNMNCKNEGKKSKKNKQQQPEKIQANAEAPRRPAQETVVQPSIAPVKHQPVEHMERDRHNSGSMTVPAAPQTPPRSTPAHSFTENQPPSDPVNPMRLPLEENVTRLVRKKDVFEEKYATNPVKQVKTKDNRKQQQKKNIVIVDMDVQSERQQTNDDSSSTEESEEIVDSQTAFPPVIGDRLTYPKPGTPAGKGYQEALLDSLKPTVSDLPSNCPKYQAGQSRPVSEILEAIILVDSTVGPKPKKGDKVKPKRGILEPSQIHFLEELFKLGLPRQGTSHLKDFILSLGYFSVSWNNITNQWQYIVNEAGRRLQERETNVQSGSRDLRAEMKKSNVSDQSRVKTPDADPYKASIERMKYHLETLSEMLSSGYDELLITQKGKKLEDDDTVPKMQPFNAVPVPLNSKPQAKGNLFKKSVVSSSSSNSFEVREDSCGQASRLEDFKHASQRDYQLVSSNLAHCETILKSLAENDRFLEISSDIKSLKMEYEVLEAKLAENIVRLQDGDMDIEPLGPIPELEGKAAALFKKVQDDFDKKIEPFWPTVCGRVRELAAEANQQSPIRNVLKFELVGEIESQKEGPFIIEWAIENICFKLGIPYHRPIRHDDECDEECLICLEKMDKSQKLSRHTCGVAFHDKCIKEWLVQSRTCPHCRKLFMSEEEYPRLGN